MSDVIRRQIIELYNSPEYISLSSYYGRRSCMDILGIARREDAHSNFLAWLLNPRENHGLQSYAVQKLLHLLVMAKNEYSCNHSAPFEKNFQDMLLVEDFKIKDVLVNREFMPSDKKDSRMDILLEITFYEDSRAYPIILENKVKSGEHGSQSDRYYDWGQKKYADKSKYAEPLYVFLSPRIDFSLIDETGRGKICKNPNYLLINYQNIVDYILEPCRKKGMSPDANFLVSDYLRCLSYSDIAKKDGDLIMAYSAEEKTLLRQFWNKNSHLLLMTIDALCSDDEIDDSDKEKMRKAVDVLENHRDTRKYLFNGREYGKSRLVEAVVNAYVAEKNPETSDELEKVFPKELQGSLGVFKKLDDIKDKSRFFVKNAIALGNGKTIIAVCNQWGLGNIGGFIEYVNEKFADSYHISESQ